MFVRADVDPIVKNSIIAIAALISKRGWHEVWVAPVNSWTAIQWCNSKCGATIVLERAKQWIGVDYVPYPVQKAGSVITTNIVAV